MAQALPIGQRDFSKGVFSDVDNFIAPPNSVRHAINFVFDEEYGSAKVRQGSTIVGSQLESDSTVLGLHNFRDRTGGNNTLLAGVNGTIYNTVTGGSLRSGMSASAVMRFETYLGATVVQNGVDAPLAFTGTGSFAANTSLGTASMPTGIDIINFKDRLWVLTSAGVLYGSSIPVSPNFNSISWTSGNVTIPIDPDASSYTGDGIGMARVSGLLLVFKERALYSFNGSATQADFLYDVGCSSVRSIATGGGNVFFFNPNGIWITRGSEPIRISRPLQAYINGMSTSNYSSVSGYANGKYYWCSIGNVTIGLTTYNNVVLRYSIATQEWAVLSYATRPTCFSQYINGTAVTVAYGDTTSRVYTLDSGTTDNGTAIPCEFITYALEFGSRGLLKDVHNKMMFYSKNSSDFEIKIAINGGDFESKGHAINDIEEISVTGDSVNFIELQVIGSSTGTPSIIRGYEFPSVSLLGYGNVSNV